MSVTPGLKRVSCVYKADSGLEYNVVVDHDTFEQGSFLTGVGADGDLPKRITMRHIWLRGADGSKKKLFFGDGTDPDYLNPDPSVDFTFWDGTYSPTGGRVAEKLRGGAPLAT